MGNSTSINKIQLGGNDDKIGEMSFDTKTESLDEIQTNQNQNQNQVKINAYFLDPFTGSEQKFDVSLPIITYNLRSWIDNIKLLPKYNAELYPYNYVQKRYQLITEEDFDEKMENLVWKYQKEYDNRAEWLNNNKPKIDSKNDPIFVQKVEIKEQASEVYLVGDIHSSLTSLLNILRILENNNKFYYNFTLQKNTYLIFLGDIVDRGPYSIELLYLICKLKLDNWNNVYIINGNHEDNHVYNNYGLGQEIINEFSVTQNNVLTKLAFLHYLPSAIFLNFQGNRFQLCHGSMTRDQIHFNIIQNFLQDKSDIEFAYLNTYQIEDGLHNHIRDDLKWGDMSNDPKTSKTAESYGRGGLYGINEIIEYNQKLKLKSIISGHQDISNLMFVTKNIGDKKFMKDPVYYDDNFLVRPVNYDNLSQKTLTYQPGEDFQALITSTAYTSKGSDEALKYDVFVKLYYKPDKLLDLTEIPLLSTVNYYKLLKKASESGYQQAKKEIMSIDQIYKLAQNFDQKGKNVQANQYFLEAAKEGHPKAIKNLKLNSEKMYKKAMNYHKEGNFDDAYLYFLKASELGHKRAPFNVGIYIKDKKSKYAKGNYKDYIKKAARRGDITAQNYLSTIM